MGPGELAVDNVIAGLKNDPVGTGMELTHFLSESIFRAWRNPDIEVRSRLPQRGNSKGTVRPEGTGAASSGST